MEKYELQKLRDLPIEGVAERLGLRVTRHKSLCPFHEDHHASLSFRVSKNTFRCFVCGASGGTIDLVMRHLHMDFKEACRFLNDGTSFFNDNDNSQRSTLNSKLSFDASRYERFFERPFLNDEARRFLFEERRLDPRVVRWCRLTSWRDRQGVPWLQIPYYDREGKLVGVQNRNLKTPSKPSTPSKPPRGEAINHSPSGESQKLDNENKVSPSGEMERGLLPRFRFPSGSRCGIYNLPVLNMLKPGEQLFITEGCSDCWAMLSAGHKAIAIPSATLLTQKDKEQLSIINSQLSISCHMYPDNDVPGERLFLQLQEVLPSLVRHQLPPDCKDFSVLYLKRLSA